MSNNGYLTKSDQSYQTPAATKLTPLPRGHALVAAYVFGLRSTNIARSM